MKLAQLLMSMLTNISHFFLNSIRVLAKSGRKCAFEKLATKNKKIQKYHRNLNLFQKVKDK